MKKSAIMPALLSPALILVCTICLVQAQEFTFNLLVAHKALNSMGLYSSMGTHLKTIDIGPNPHEMVFSPDRKLIYVTNNGVMRWMSDEDGGNTISIIDAAACKKIGEISTGKFRRPHGIDLDTESGIIAVTCEKPDRLLIIDPVQKKVITDYDTGGKVSHNVILDRGAKWAYVTNIKTNNIGAVNLVTGEIVNIPTGPSVQDGVISKDGKTLFAACSTYVAVIDLGKKREIAQIPIGATRIALTSDGKELITATRPASVGFIDVNTRKVTARVKIPGDPYSMSISADGKFAFTGAEQDNEFYVISIADHKLIKIFKTIAGARPDPVLDIPAY